MAVSCGHLERLVTEQVLHDVERCASGDEFCPVAVAQHVPANPAQAGFACSVVENAIAVVWSQEGAVPASEEERPRVLESTQGRCCPRREGNRAATLPRLRDVQVSAFDDGTHICDIRLSISSMLNGSRYYIIQGGEVVKDGTFNFGLWDRETIRETLVAIVRSMYQGADVTVELPEARVAGA